MNRHLIFSTHFGEAALIYREIPFAIVKILIPRKNRGKLKAFIEKGDGGNPFQMKKS